ncbi:MAG: NAD(P)H-dependent oxidoreductase [Saprospirales bacterium]|nr:MAG: NAD(P)H-dependent oxidoreductase [Saprospirales bacterium]
MKILIISSTIRSGRKSHQVALEVAKQLNAREGFTAKVIDVAETDLDNLKYLYKLDPSPSEIKSNIYDLFENCDGYIFVSPEYNGSYCGALKNTVDHYPKSCYHRKPIGVVAVSAGAMGGMRAALQMQLLVLALMAYPMPKMLLTPKVGDKFEDGRLMDNSFSGTIESYLDDFTWFASKLKS